jgi:hypothetical protein
MELKPLDRWNTSKCHVYLVATRSSLLIMYEPPTVITQALATITKMMIYNVKF